MTGSSWQILTKSPAGQAFLTAEGSKWQVRSPKGDRGDEWGVITPNALAQWNHHPKFPIVNTNIGPEGQNMGVVGMFGVPIKQWAALARPATWGYFVLPLRQAMSWQWQIQFWGCLLVVWWFLNTLKPIQSGRNFALSAAFCMVPYAAAWSNWPLYASLFPVLAFCLFAQLLRTRKIWQAGLLGMALGWALAAWVLVLYPPWLVIVGSFCAALMLGWIWDHRADVRWGGAQWLAVTLAIAVAGALLGSWWLDTRDAVAAIQSTVYPGGRQVEQGGTAHLVWFLRGYLGLEAFADKMGPASNKSEVSSYFFVPLAMCAVLVAGCFKAVRFKGSWLALTLFVAVYGWYTFIGFPVWLAQITKWGVMTTNRMDVGLGLAFVVMLALMQPMAPAQGPQTLRRVVGATLALLSAALAWWVLSHISPDLMPLNTMAYQAAIVLICGAMAWWLWHRQVAPVVTTLLVLGFGAALGFNPISKAPKAVSLADEVKPFVATNVPNQWAKTLVVDGDALPAMALASVNVPVVDGVLYYPHRSLWRDLQLADDLWPVVNRYQHLTFVPDAQDLPAPHYRVEAQRMDAVAVHFDPATFDFTQTGALRVVAHRINERLVAQSPQLERMGEHQNYVWFRVRKQE